MSANAAHMIICLSSPPHLFASPRRVGRSTSLSPAQRQVCARMLTRSSYTTAGRDSPNPGSSSTSCEKSFSKTIPMYSSSVQTWNVSLAAGRCVLVLSVTVNLNGLADESARLFFSFSVRLEQIFLFECRKYHCRPPIGAT